MFGKLHDIWDVLPNYVVDYQEHGRTEQGDARWIDRITLDGTWSGNLFDFYRRTYRKLISDLKVPFSLEDGRRKDETQVHIALREALVNCIIHADYSGTSSILVLKRPDAFVFRNPGLMRVPPDIARQGGDGDARNRALQHMFFLIGASDRAGTGVPTIYKGWKERGWLPPSFAQLEEPSDQTRLDLRMVDLLPTSALDHLSKQFGDRFSQLTADQRLALATAATEGTVSNTRMQDICSLHRSDITKMLQSLVRDGFLEQTGRTSGTIYFLPGGDSDYQGMSLDELIDFLNGNFGTPLASSQNEGVGSLNEQAGGKDEEVGAQSEQPQNEEADDFSSLIDELLNAPVAPSHSPLPILSISDLDSAPPEIAETLRKKAYRSNAVGKISPALMREIIYDICLGQFLSAKVLAHLLRRDERYLRDKLLTPMVVEGKLQRAFPNLPSSPKQSYKSIE